MPNETFHWIDWLIIISYLGLIIYIGRYFSEKNKSTGDYFVGRRSIPAWAIGMSVLATLISSVTFLAYPGQGFSGNWILLVQGLAAPLTLITIIWFIVPLYRQFIGISAYEYFENRFGYFSLLYSSLAFFGVYKPSELERTTYGQNARSIGLSGNDIVPGGYAGDRFWGGAPAN